MSFDQLSDAGKVWVIVFHHAIHTGLGATWGQMSRAVHASGVPLDQNRAGRKELERFIQFSHQASAKARADRQRIGRKSRK